jgi:hypothetical protein
VGTDRQTHTPFMRSIYLLHARNAGKKFVSNHSKFFRAVLYPQHPAPNSAKLTSVGTHTWFDMANRATKRCGSDVGSTWFESRPDRRLSYSLQSLLTDVTINTLNWVTTT